MARLTFLSTIVLVALIAFPAIADAPDIVTVPSQRHILIEGLEKIPDIAVIGRFGKGSAGRAWVMEEGEAVAPRDNDDEFAVYTMSKAALKKAGGVDKVDLDALVKAGKAFKQRMPRLYVFEQIPRDDAIYIELLYYRVGSVVGGRAFFEASGVKYAFVGKDDAEKRWSVKAPIQSMDMTADVEKVSSSSALSDPLYPSRYGVPMAFDGDPETAWSEGAKGPGIGQYIEVTFAVPVKADSVLIMPGWFQKEFHKKNNRVKSLSIMVDGKETVVALKDVMEGQIVPLDPKKEMKTVRFTIKDVYKTEKWDDTPIAEIQFLLGGKRIKVDAANAVLPRTLLDEQSGRDD